MAKKIVSVGVNDLASQCPEVAAEWDYSENGELLPEDVYYKTSKRVHWVCGACGHKWVAPVRTRVERGTGCMRCGHKRAQAIRAKPAPGKSLADMYPDLAAEWHPTKNGDLTPYDIMPGHDKKVWWLGKCGHEWEAPTYNRTKGHGCPYCSNQKVLVGFNDLATTHPDLAAEWHPTKNGDLTPQDVVAGSTSMVWWLDSLGHDWKAKPLARLTKGTGCPYCANQRIWKGFNDLASTYPSIAAQWHPTKNGQLTPSDVMYGTPRAVWWLCEHGHEWKTSIRQRTSRGSGCPKCSGRVVDQGVNDLATVRPDIAAEWHPTKNGDMTPSTTAPYIAKKVWWLGKCGHEWKMPIVSRTKENSGCPICGTSRHSSFSEKAVAYYLSLAFDDVKQNHKPEDGSFGKMDLDVYIPSIATAVEYDGGYWHKDERDARKDALCKKAGIRLIRIRDRLCSDYDGCRAEIIRRPDDTRESLNACIVELLGLLDVGESITVDTAADAPLILASIDSRSVDGSFGAAHPELLDEWDYEKNAGLSPFAVFPKSQAKVWWTCSNGHSYQAMIGNRSSGHGCRFCAYEKLRKNQSAPSVGNRLSAVAPIAASEWHPTLNGDLTPDDFSCGSNASVWWRCPQCSKDYYMSISRRAKRNNVGCPSCAIGNALSKPKPGESLQDVYPDVAAEWHPTKNGGLAPGMVSKCSAKVVWWRGRCGHEWQSSIDNRTRAHRGCPYCASQKVLAGFNDLATRNPELAAQWDYDKNDGVTPRDILPGSNKKYWWVCPECGNEWQAVVGSRNSGCGCPKCRGKHISESKRASNARRRGRQMSIDFSAVRRNDADSE